jgi:hypothetical protein
VSCKTRHNTTCHHPLLASLTLSFYSTIYKLATTRLPPTCYTRHRHIVGISAREASSDVLEIMGSRMLNSDFTTRIIITMTHFGTYPVEPSSSIGAWLWSLGRIPHTMSAMMYSRRRRLGCALLKSRVNLVTWKVKVGPFS